MRGGGRRWRDARGRGAQAGEAAAAGSKLQLAEEDLVQALGEAEALRAQLAAAAAPGAKGSESAPAASNPGAAVESGTAAPRVAALEKELLLRAGAASRAREVEAGRAGRAREATERALEEAQARCAALEEELQSVRGKGAAPAPSSDGDGARGEQGALAEERARRAALEEELQAVRGEEQALQAERARRVALEAELGAALQKLSQSEAARNPSPPPTGSPPGASPARLARGKPEPARPAPVGAASPPAPVPSKGAALRSSLIGAALGALLCAAVVALVVGGFAGEELVARLPGGALLAPGGGSKAAELAAQLRAVGRELQARDAGQRAAEARAEAARRVLESKVADAADENARLAGQLASRREEAPAGPACGGLEAQLAAARRELGDKTSAHAALAARVEALEGETRLQAQAWAEEKQREQNRTGFSGGGASQGLVARDEPGGGDCKDKVHHPPRGASWRAGEPTGASAPTHASALLQACLIPRRRSALSKINLRATQEEQAIKWAQFI